MSTNMEQGKPAPLFRRQRGSGPGSAISAHALAEDGTSSYLGGKFESNFMPDSPGESGAIAPWAAFSSVTRNLKAHPDTAAYVCGTILACFALMLGVHPFWTVLLVCLPTLMYNVRRTMAEAHERAMADNQVRQIEASKGSQVKAGGRARLSKPSKTGARKRR